MAKKKLSELELKLKKLALLAKTYTDSKASADKVYLIEKATATTGYLKTYILAAGTDQESEATGDKLIGTIDIPKDFLVKSGEVKTVTTANQPYAGAVVGDKYIDLTINSQAGDATGSHIYIPVKDLVDVYTGSNAIDVSNANVISLKLGTNKNGMSITANGLELALASGSAAGAMSAAHYSKLDALYTKAELDTKFGNKADKVASATNGNFAGLDANGNLTDSGKKAADFQPAGNYKTTQTAKTDPSASGNAIAFIDSITQNANGEITATKKTLQAATSSQAGSMSATDKAKLDNLYALLSDAELGSWFGYDANSTMVTTTLPAVSDDSITDE